MTFSKSLLRREDNGLGQNMNSIVLYSTHLLRRLFKRILQNVLIKAYEVSGKFLDLKQEMP